MKHTISVYSLSNDRSLQEDVELPYSCPICGTTLSPDVLDNTLIECEDEEDNMVFLFNHCPKCNECFISRHIYDFDYGGYIFESSAPSKHVETHFSDNIHSLSPEFVSIYNEALRAESLGMTSICGMGYRKALEFLVKDYSIKQNPDSETQIIKLPLSQCIEKYISDKRLKTLAKASAWLGNDETHYIKAHPDYGLNELKIFINAFVTFIDSELAYYDAESLLTSNR